MKLPAFLSGALFGSTSTVEAPAAQPVDRANAAPASLPPTKLFAQAPEEPRSGTVTRTWPDGTPKEELTLVDGHAHGPVTRWYPDGTLKAEFQLCWGALHGPFARFHPNGKLSEDGEWIDGLPHRAYCRWWPNGQRRVQGAFHHGRPMGLWTAWHPDGAVLYRGPWIPDLAAALHSAVRAQVTVEGPDPAVTTFERACWDGEYANLT